jgi:heptosyltransferase I
LIVMMSAAGDTVHVLPVINALKRHAPSTRITWVLQPGPATLVQGHRSVDEILLFDRARGWRAFADMRRALASKAFDLVINLQVYLKAGVITALARSPMKLGFDRRRARDLNWLVTTHRIPARTPQHVQDQYFEFLAYVGVFSTFERPAAPIVVATSKPEKDWVPERWAEVSDALWHDFNLEPVLVGGRSPRELHAERVITGRARHKPRSALGSGLRRLLSILDGSALALSPDTGPLMGYTNPRRSGPYRRFHDLIVDAYGDPGEEYPISAEWRPGRMSRIVVRDVLDKVELWRQKYEGRG